VFRKTIFTGQFFGIYWPVNRSVFYIYWPVNQLCNSNFRLLLLPSVRWIKISNTMRDQRSTLLGVSIRITYFWLAISRVAVTCKQTVIWQYKRYSLFELWTLLCTKRSFCIIPGALGLWFLLQTAQRLRLTLEVNFNVMRSINLRFTYLLIIFLILSISSWFSVSDWVSVWPLWRVGGFHGAEFFQSVSCDRTGRMIFVSK